MNGLDSLRECKESFLVCGLQLDGRGDVYGAHEIHLRLKMLMPEAKIVFTVLNPRFSALEAFLFSNKTFVNIRDIQEQEGWEIAAEVDALAAAHTFKKIIVYPTYHDSTLPVELLERNDDVIKLRENSVHNTQPQLVKGSTYVLGLDVAKGEKGVLLPLEFSRGIPPRTRTNTLERLSCLERVRPILSKLILGKDFSLEAAQEFHRSSKLYLGYFSQPEVFFCYINALLRCKKGNLSICNTQNRPEGLLENIKRTLWKNGFGRIRIIEFTSEADFKIESKEFKSDPIREKTCTLIFRPLSGGELGAMLDATEDESLVTGDLSPYRFMAHRKTIAYDTRAQKHEAAQSMVALAAKFNRRFERLLPQAFFGASAPSEEVNVIALEDGMIAFFKAMEEIPGLKKDWDRFIDEIFANHDFTPHLEKILEERGT